MGEGNFFSGGDFCPPEKFQSSSEKNFPPSMEDLPPPKLQDVGGGCTVGGEEVVVRDRMGGTTREEAWNKSDKYFQ